jgi:hypothetical protein
MNAISVKGDPEAVSSFLQSIINAGNNINVLKLTKNNSEYVVVYSGISVGSRILLENGDYLLLESGDKILLE